MKSTTSRTLRPLLAVTLLAMLAGCSNLRIPFFGEKNDKDPSYASARAEVRNRPLEVPPDLSAPDGNVAFSIPGISAAQISPSGQKLLASGAVSPRFDKVKLESAGGQRWLVVNAPIEAVWPQARQFWLDQGFELKLDSAALAILETNFIEQKPELPVGAIRSALSRALDTVYSSGMVDQYRMRLERGSDNTTEIYISHQGMEEVYITQGRDDTRWTPTKANPEREAVMLKQLLVRLGVGTDEAVQVASAATKPVVATTDNDLKAGATVRAQLIKIDGVRAVKVLESFDRAWRRIGIALERNGYVITDRDRKLGIYYIKPGIGLKAKEEKTLLSKLAFWRSDDDKKTNALDDNAHTQLVFVTNTGPNETTVKASGKEGAALDEAASKALLDPLSLELR